MDDDASLGQLDELAARLRALDSAGVAIATEARAAVEAEARATAAAGTDPAGAAWAPTKKDGRAALPKAASSIHAVVSGSTKAVLTLVMQGPYVFHQRSKNKSAKKGLPRRVILPDADTGVPEGITDAIQAAAVKIARRAIGGGT